MRTIKFDPVSGSTSPAQPYDFFLIGIGSSEGGLEPLKTILAHLSADISAAVIVIHNGPSDSPVELSKLLHKVSLLPVIMVQKQERLRPGHVYVLPSSRQVRLHEQVIFCETDCLAGRQSHVIDACFRSIARESRERSICVVLSGGGYDGLEGAIAVEKQGGLVIVQDPATAKFPMMPVTTIANDDPSFVLDPEDIADLINTQVG